MFIAKLASMGPLNCRPILLHGLLLLRLLLLLLRQSNVLQGNLLLSDWLILWVGLLIWLLGLQPIFVHLNLGLLLLHYLLSLQSGKVRLNKRL